MCLILKKKPRTVSLHSTVVAKTELYRYKLYMDKCVGPPLLRLIKC